jgi:hypothetical protein
MPAPLGIPIAHDRGADIPAWHISLRTIATGYEDTHMRKTAIASLIAVAALMAFRATGNDALLDGFLHPPPEARLRCYWWWLNGNTNETTITHDLEEMRAKGYGGALLVDADGSGQRDNRQVSAGPMFGTPRWRQMYRHALKEANRLGLEISLNVVSGWNLGGPMVTPERGAKLLTWSRTTVQGPVQYQGTLAQPKSNLGYYRDIAVLAYPLRHDGESPERRPIRMLAVKSASRESGMSMPPSAPLLEDFPAQPGEEDTRAGDVQDASPGLAADSRFTWQVPAGTWEILRIGYTSSGARVSTSSGDWQGLAIDYLDHTVLESYWHEVVQPLLDDARPYLGNTLRYLVTDSWELGGLNWTARFREEFRQRRGYDLLPYLPVVAGRIVEDRDTSNRFLNDLRRTVGDLVVHEHYAPFAQLAARSGLGIHPESGGPHGAPIDALETLGVGAFPQTEFWAVSSTHRVRDEERFFVKEASSAAHTYGKIIVAGEGMTSIGPQWEESIWNDLKPTFDRALCEGLNRLVWHTFTSSPAEMGLPGQEYFAGTHMNPNVTWWPQAKVFFSYINRSQFLLQQGRPVSDAVYYYGDQVPNFVRLKSDDPANVLPGYDYDAVDEHVLVHDMRVEAGRIVLPGGVSYAVLVLPERDTISLDALRAVRNLAMQGAIVRGPKPHRTTGLTTGLTTALTTGLTTGSSGSQGDAEVQRIAAEMWGDCGPAGHAFGKGMVYCGMPTRDLLAARGLPPDFAGPFDYVHRQTDGADIYFVHNAQDRELRAEVLFRIMGRAPELWHADTGETEVEWVHDFTADGRTRMPLVLEPYGSVFVVFRAPETRRIVEVRQDGQGLKARSLRVHMDSGAPSVEASEAGNYTLRTASGEVFSASVPSVAARQIEGPWTVKFQPGWGAPASVLFERLQSWTESADPGIRYYSGAATYTTQFTLSSEEVQPGRIPWLDLGDVREIAEVRLNGQDAGIAWKKPFSVNIGAAVRSGRNDLEVRVTNLWPNRLIGDQRLPEAQRHTKTNITKFTADSPLMPSGLLGPVTIRFHVVATARHAQ